MTKIKVCIVGSLSWIVLQACQTQFNPLGSSLEKPQPMETLTFEKIDRVKNTEQPAVVSSSPQAITEITPLKYSQSQEKPSSKSPPSNQILSKGDIVKMAQEQAKRFKAEVDLILGIIEKESSFNPKAVSPSGAKGLMQLMPITVEHINLNSPVTIHDPFDPHQNVAGGTWYIQSILKTYAQWQPLEQIRLGLAAYNAGPGTLKRILDKIETQEHLVRQQIGWQHIRSELPEQTIRYVEKIMALKEKYKS